MGLRPEESQSELDQGAHHRSPLDGSYVPPPETTSSTASSTSSRMSSVREAIAQKAMAVAKNEKLRNFLA